MYYKNLFELAAQMLRETNPFNSDIEELIYTTSVNGKRTEYCLLTILKKIIGSHKKSSKKDGAEQTDLTYCLKCISESFYRYYETFDTYSYAHKNLVKQQLYNWQMIIKERYNIDNTELVDELEPERDDLDKGIALIKLLHNRDGINVKEMSSKLDISERAVQKGIRKLSCKNKEDSSYYIGGQPVSLNINIKDDRRPPLYNTKNTLHPIVLQENLMQVADLMHALADSYIEKGRFISFVNGINIWTQLSEYAKKRIKTIYTPFDDNLKSFIIEIETQAPNDMTVSIFTSERNMINEWGGSDEEMLRFYLKGKNRKCDIKLKDNTVEMKNQTLEICIDEHGTETILIKDDDGDIVEVQYDEIEYVN